MIKDSIIYINSSFFSKATPFLLLPILMSYLSPEEMGMISLFLSLVTFFLIICGLSTDGIVTVDYFRLGKEKVKFSITAIGMIVISITSFMVIILFLVRDFLPSIADIAFGYFILALVVASCQVLTIVNLSLWQAEREPIKFGLYEVSQSLLNISLSLYLVIILKYGDDGRIFGYSISFFCFSFISVFFLLKRKYIKFSINIEQVKPVLKFGMLLMPHALALWITANISRFFLSNLMDNTQVGIYFVATQLGIVITVLALATQKAFVPYIYQLLNDEKHIKESKQKVVKSAYYYFLFILLSTIVIFFAFSILFDHYAEIKYLKALEVLPWIMVGILFHAWGIFFTNVTLYTKKTHYLSIATFIAAFIHIIISYLGIKYYGLTGAAISFAITNFIALNLSAFTSNIVLPLPWLSHNVNTE